MTHSEVEPRQVTLAELAAITASLDAGSPRDEVLAAAGLSVEAWQTARERWLSKLAAQAERGQLGPSRRYLELMAEQTSRARAEARAARKGLQGPMPVAPEAHLAPLQRAIQERATPLSVDIAPHEPAVAPPWAKPSEVVVPAPVRFGPTTTLVGVLSPFAASAELPFARPGRPPAAPPASMEVTLPPARLVASESWALPFPKSSAAAGPIASVAPPQPAPSAPAGPGGVDAETMRRLDGISLMQYASICASVRVNPDRISEIQSHFGLDKPSWIALHAMWHERFQRDPQLRARWQALIAQRSRR